MIKQYAAKERSDITIYYIREEICFQKSTAILRILKDLGGLWSCFYLFIFIPALIRDAIWLLIARNRHRIL